LKGAAETGADAMLCFSPFEGPAIQQDAPAARPQRAGDEVENGGLAGAIGPDQPGDAATLDAERDIVDGLYPAEMLRHADHLQHRPPAPRQHPRPSLTFDSQSTLLSSELSERQFSPTRRIGPSRAHRDEQDMTHKLLLAHSMQAKNSRPAKGGA